MNIAMDKVVSYNEFLKHKDNLENYLKELFDKVPELNVYFPISLSSEERHLIYTKSKGYLFEKLHKIGSKYSIKLWKPVEDGVNSVTEEKSEKENFMNSIPEEKSDEEDCLNSIRDEKSDEEDCLNSIRDEEDCLNSIRDEEGYVTDEDEDYMTDEDYNFNDDLSNISNMLEKHHDIMFSELRSCRRSVNRVECVFTFIMIFNFVGSILFLTQVVDFMVHLPRLNTITDF